MPELPEVETVKRGLAPTMENALIENVEQRRANLRFPFPDGFADRLTGRRIISLGRRAKYLLIDLDNGQVLIAHLGMSGSFRIDAAMHDTTTGSFHHERSKDGKHDHVVLHLQTKTGPATVVYNDPRRFGFMDIVQRTELSAHPFFRELGVEPTGNQLDAHYLANKFARKKAPLKAALLDQRIIAGLGNIYVCEALWRAKLSPLRKAESVVGKTGLPNKALRELTQHIHDVIADAIDAGGSSLRDHIQTDGSLGYFQHRFAVYDREGEPCRHNRCGHSITRIVQSGRSSFYCAKCQR